MRSRAEFWPRLEWVSRGIATVLLLLLLGVRVTSRESRVEGTTAALRASLERWSTVEEPQLLQLRLDRPPDGVERDWLAALAASGTEVRWSGPSLVATAMSVAPVADPQGGIDVLVAAPTGSLIHLLDTLGVRDSATGASGGNRFHLTQSVSSVEARVGPVQATDSPRDSLTLGRLLVLGRAGWETKFTIAALEERGWQVDARLAVAKGADITRAAAQIDTTRYSAVLALDSTAARSAGEITRFVRSGGGLLLWPGAATTKSLAVLAPGGAGPIEADRSRSPAAGPPRAALDLSPITSLKPDALVLERRGDVVSVAARREGLGRVTQVGYLDLWRWRMAGAEGSVEAHRAWLARLVSGVAWTRRTAIKAPPGDAAPLATLIDKLGPASDPAPPSLGSVIERWSGWLFAGLLLALLAEVVSRRARGVR